MAPSPLHSLTQRVAVSTTHLASLSMVAAFTGPATQCSTRPSGAQKYAATLPPCLVGTAPFGVVTILNVATFWNDDTQFSLRNFPTSGLARAFTRSASALFQVNCGSSK